MKITVVGQPNRRLPQAQNTCKITSMEIRSKKKALFLALAVCMILSVVFTGVLAASILEHDCIGEENGCPYCLQISMAKIFLKTFKIAIVIIFAALVFIFCAQISQKHTVFVLYPYSPISLKVRFNS